MALRVILGKHPTNGQYGLWISKPGAEATSTNREDFLFDSANNPVRLYASGTARLVKHRERTTFSENGWTVYYAYFKPATITHNLGYVPIFYVSGGYGYLAANTGGTVLESITIQGGLETPHPPDIQQAYQRVNQTTGELQYLSGYDPVSQTMDGLRPSTYVIYRNRML